MQVLQDRGAKVVLQSTPATQSSYSSLKDVFDAALNHERGVTASINNLYEKALVEKDYPAQIILQWFIEEQVEEESPGEYAGGVADGIL